MKKGGLDVPLGIEKGLNGRVGKEGRVSGDGSESPVKGKFAHLGVVAEFPSSALNRKKWRGQWETSRALLIGDLAAPPQLGLVSS